ncbi:MAG TPA: hypothetical protein VFV19_15205 [Candidatus Polarisedimenticolaceae bacterium]|nr:hypothetical protein [Candidatus Polarisedimenticolaceae bacterium]
MRRLVLLALLAAPPALASSAHLEIAAKTAKLGDAIPVRLTVDPGSDGTVDVSALPTEWGPAQVLSGAWQPAAPGSAVRTWAGSIAIYQLGKATIPEVRVAVGSAGAVAVTEPVDVTIEGTVAPADPKAKELADLKPPASIPADWGPLKAALAALALLLVGAGIAWWLWRRYAAKLAAVPAAVDPFRKLPPHVWVYEELERLLARRLAEEGQIGLFYDELTRIVKLYLEGRYRIELMERTTSEVLPALKLAGAPMEASTLARALLDSSDRVKFAREPAGAAECRAAVEEAYRLVDLTKPAALPEPAPAGPAS